MNFGMFEKATKKSYILVCKLNQTL